MSRKVLATSRRAAIWRAHERRCIYCAELIGFPDLDIDHIVPYRLLNELPDLERLKSDYGLPQSFDIDGHANLVPAHRRCNLQKLGEILPKSRALHFLSIAEVRAEKAQKMETRIQQQVKRDNVTVLVQTALDTGILGAGQLTALLSAYAATHNVFEVLEALPFAGSELKGYFSSTDVDFLYEKQILPRRNGLDHLGMMREGSAEDEKISVTSCREWAEAVRDGYFAYSTYGMKEETLFRKVYALVASLSQATVPTKSYIADPKVGVADFELLPLKILPALSSDAVEELERLEAQGVRMSELVSSGRVKVIDRSSLCLTLHFDYMGLVLSEIMRADMNGDGVEDLLVGSYEWALGGTHGGGAAFVLTRESADKVFTFARDVRLAPEKEIDTNKTERTH